MSRTKVPDLPPELMALVPYLDGLDRRLSSVEDTQTTQGDTLSSATASIATINSSLAVTNPFTQLFHMQEQSANNVDGQFIASGSGWSQRNQFVEIRADIPGVSLASDQSITVSPGTYFILATVSGWIANSLRSRLMDVSHGVQIALSTSARPSSTGNSTGLCIIAHVFTLTATSSLQIQTYLGSSNLNTYQASNTGEIETGADVMLWKLS